MAIRDLITWATAISAVVAAPSSSGFLSNIQSPGPGVSQRILGTSFGIPGKNADFDYVIIGGGTAGLTVAKRLSEDPTLKIAVVEAGSFYEIDNGNVSQIPALYYKNFNQTADPTNIQPLVDWGLVLPAQTGLAGRPLHYAQGKTLGGSSGRNSNIVTRSTIGWFQRLANQIGDSSWNWNGVLPYYKKSVQFSPPSQAAAGNITYDANAYDPAGGPLHVTYSNYYQPMNTGLLQAFSSLGFKALQGLVSGSLLGYGFLSVTIDPTTQLKDSSETAFLWPALENSTLALYKTTYAKKILFDGNKTATGVQVATNGYSYTLNAKKEVIVAAGVTRSPQVLMVSGIGPSAILKQHNITVLKDLPVGQNWQDHCAFEFTYPMGVEGNAPLDGNVNFLANATQAFLTSQNGPLTNWGGDILAFEKLPSPYRNALNTSALQALSILADDQPEVEWLTASHGPQGAMSSYVTFTPALVAPLSRGTIGLTSADTADNPIVDPKTLTDPTDRALAVQVFKRLQDVVKASGLVTGPEMKVGLSPNASDSQILTGIQQTGLPWYHGVGSCPMGNQTDPSAVVDSHGRVYGVKGVRVVDASIIPFAAPGHSMSLVYMLAEKISDNIKQGQ